MKLQIVIDTNRDEEILIYTHRKNPLVVEIEELVNKVKNDKDFAERLLRIYWELPYFGEWDFRRSERIENKLAQCIRNKNSDYSIFKMSSGKREAELKDFHKSKRLYEDTYFLLLKYYNKK